MPKTTGVKIDGEIVDIRTYEGKITAGIITLMTTFQVMEKLKRVRGSH